MLWFQEVTYFSVFLLKFQVRLAILMAVAGFTAVYLLSNLAIAHRLKHLLPVEVHHREKLIKPSYSVKLSRSSPFALPSTVALRLPPDNR